MQHVVDFCKLPEWAPTNSRGTIIVRFEMSYIRDVLLFCSSRAKQGGRCYRAVRYLYEDGVVDFVGRFCQHTSVCRIFSLLIVPVLIVFTRYLLESRLRDLVSGLLFYIGDFEGWNLRSSFYLGNYLFMGFGACRFTWQLVITYSGPIVSRTE